MTKVRLKKRKKPTHGNFRDLTGEYFGYLKILRYVGVDYSANHYWAARCPCLKTVVAQGNNLKSGRTVSCGCIKDKEGFVRLEWSAMISRFTDEKHPDWPEHGGIGRKVHDLFKSFRSFRSNAGVPALVSDLKLINPRGDFRPGNVRWIASPSRNFGNPRYVNVGGRKVQAAHLARELGVEKHEVFNRLNRGQTAEQIYLELCGLF